MKKLIFLLMFCSFASQAHAVMDEDIMTHVVWHQYQCSEPRLGSGQTFVGVSYTLQCAVVITGTEAPPDVSECRFYESAISPQSVQHLTPLQKIRSEEPNLVAFTSQDGQVRVRVSRQTLNADVDFTSGAQMECAIVFK